jgi:hypothetical protein
VIDLKPVTALRGVGDSGARRTAARLGRGNHAGSAVPAAAALRGPHARRAAGRAHARPAGGGRGRGAAHGSRVSRPAPNALQDRRRIRFFHAAVLSTSPRSSSEGLARGVRIRCFGEARRGPKGWRSCIRNIGASTAPPRKASMSTSRRSIPAPKASRRDGCASWSDGARSDQRGDLKDWLPPPCSPTRACPRLHEALRYVHRPPGGCARGACCSIGGIRRSAGSPSRNCWRTSCR